MSDESKPWIDELITQALAYIAKTTPFGNIPVVGNVINSIASKSIKIALENTAIGSYISQQITDDLNKQALKVKDARELLKKATTPEEKKRYEEQIKESLRTLFTF